MWRGVRLICVHVILVLMLSLSSTGWAQSSSENDSLGFFTTFTWVGAGVFGVALGVILGTVVSSSVGVGAKAIDDQEEERSLLLDDYMHNHPSRVLEATAWADGPALREMALICGFDELPQRREMGKRLRLHRAEVVALMEQPGGLERGQSLERLSCGEGMAARRGGQ